MSGAVKGAGFLLLGADQNAAAQALRKRSPVHHDGRGHRGKGRMIDPPCACTSDFAFADWESVIRFLVGFAGAIGIVTGGAILVLWFLVRVIK